MTDVLAYSASARDAEVQESALMAKLDAARQQLAPPFASERVDLVASVADTLLGAHRSAATEGGDRLSLLLGAFLSGRQRQYRALAAGDQHPYARHRRPLPRAAGGS